MTAVSALRTACRQLRRLPQASSLSTSALRAPLTLISSSSSSDPSLGSTVRKGNQLHVSPSSSSSSSAVSFSTAAATPTLTSTSNAPMSGHSYQPPLSRPSSCALSNCIEELKGRFDGPNGCKLSLNPNVLEAHGKDESYHKAQPPNAVLYPESTEQVAAAVGICARWEVPVIPFGAGTSLEGHVHALYGGVSLDTTKMDGVLAINAEDMDVHVQCGITRSALQKALRHTGLFFPVDPGADATLGGMAATRASGTTAVRYGTMLDNVLGLTAVMANGQVIHTGSRARKSSAGYDLTHLLVGSEGTLGVITELHLRLHGQPAAICGARASFSDVHSAVTAAMLTLQMGIPLARCELLDKVSVEAINAFSGTKYPASPTLFLEFHGISEASVEEQAKVAKDVAAECGAIGYEWSADAQEREKLWHARHNAYYAATALRPGSSGQPTDVCVPRSRLADCISETAEDVLAAGLVAPIFGHVGDGNFHVILTHHPDDSAEMQQKTKEVNYRLVQRALAMKGTCTGEHGIGFGKMRYMEKEHGKDCLEVMSKIKKALDPKWIMNPGKVIP